jgi:hypothetical protein
MIRSLEKVEELLAEMSLDEKLQVLQLTARDLGAATEGVEKDPDVVGGEPVSLGLESRYGPLCNIRNLGQLMSSYCAPFQH